METEREEQSSPSGAPPPASRPPPSAAPPPTPEEADQRFIQALRGAHLIEDMSDGLLAVLLEGIAPNPNSDARRLDLLLAYFGGAGDAEAAQRRIASDRFLMHDGNDPQSAPEFVARLCGLAPELGHVELERIGSSEGPLVLRHGDHLAAVTDMEDDDLDTGEIDLSELDNPSVTIRGLVVAVNVLLGQMDVRARFVPLAGDGEREAFVAVGVAEASALLKAGCLELEKAERLLEFCAW